jgi:nucleotide-binding universal stress UspA family protein
MTMQHSLSPLVRSQHPLRLVLIGTSLGEESDQVVRTGLAVARAAGARVHLVHAVQLETLPIGGLDAEAGAFGDPEQIARRGEALELQAERLGIEQRELAGLVVRTGAPYRVLAETARQAGADLIVVGATGSGPFAAELLGSTADRILRKAACPVLVVRNELRIPPRRVLAPVDLSTLSGDAFHCGMHVVAQLAGPETEVAAVYALSFLDAAAARQRAGGMSIERVERAAAEELGRFVRENRPAAPVPLTATVRSGEARTEILRALEEQPTDLLVLGTHGRGGWDRLVLGSVASTLARKAPCSVLVISPEAALAEGLAEAVAVQTAPAWHHEPASA